MIIMSENARCEQYSEFFINLKVHEPRYENGSYVSYEVVIETNNPAFSLESSCTRRRYSEFCALRKLLLKEFPAMKIPSLPPKYPFKNNLQSAFIERRRKELEEFLKSLVAKEVCLSSKAVHLFLQSYFTMNEIKDIVKGKAENTDSFTLHIENRYKELSISSTSSSEDKDVLSQKENSSIDENAHCLKRSENPCESSTTFPQASKRVSFCDKVIVAQVHLE